MSAPQILIVNGNEPSDVAMLVCRGMLEFFQNHMGDKAQENFQNFMPALVDLLLSDKGREAMEVGWTRLQELADATVGS